MSASLSDLKRGELRTKAEHELIATEKTYVAFMTTLVEVFVQPLETWFQRVNTNRSMFFLRLLCGHCVIMSWFTRLNVCVANYS